MVTPFMTIDTARVPADGRALSEAAGVLRSSHTYDGVPGAAPYPVITSAVADFQQEWKASSYSVDVALDHLGRLAVEAAAGFARTDEDAETNIWDRCDAAPLTRRLST